MKLLTLVYLILAVTSLADCQSQHEPAMKHESTNDRDAAFAQYPDALYPIRVKNKWGYMNRKGDIVIKPVFETADDFFDGLAIVSIARDNQTHYGFIDTKGNWAIDAAYGDAKPFSENKAAVKNGGLYGYIDNHGKEIIAFQFEQAGRFTEERAAVRKNGWVGFIDSTGTMVIEPKFTCSVDHPVFVNGMAPVFGADEMTGYIGLDGLWKIEPKYHSAARFVNGKAWAMIDEGDAGIKGGYIDTSGEFVIAPEYDFGWDFSEGYATVWKISEDRQNKLWSVLDSDGNSILKDMKYRNVGAMSSGLIPIQDDKMRWGFMNIKGAVVIAPQFTGINHFKNGIARMEVGSAFDPEPVYINAKGDIVWEK